MREWEFMEKEIIRFGEFGLPMVLYHLHMQEGMAYRGMHSHAAIEIVAVKSGVLRCCINGDTICVYPNQILFINSNTGHRLFSENAEILYMHMDTSVLNENANDDGRSKIYTFILRANAKPYMLFTDNKEITELLHKISVKYYEEPKDSRWYLKAYLYEVVAFMYSQSFVTPLTIFKEQIDKIEPVVRYIDDNFNLPITLDNICSVVMYNKYTVCHTFKAVTGSTVFDYINFVRVNFAIEQLREKNNSILEIAVKSGFSSATYFNRVFKNIIGCSPSVYRKLLSENIMNQ